MFLRKYWLPLSVFLVAIAGVGLYLLATQPPKDPIVIYKTVKPLEKSTAEVPKGDTSQGGHWKPGDQWHAEPHETEKLPLVDALDKHNPVAAPQGIGYPPLPPSSVPDDIPEHLKFPDEWKLPYYGSYSGPSPFSIEESERLVSILREIIRDYNPHRPIGDIWHQFIEYEKMYRAYAEVDLNRTPVGSFSANRADWHYEQAWAFPEITEVFLGEATRDEKEMLFQARLIAMGEDSPNWNEHILHDGRAFYLRYDTRYKFKWTTPEGVERTRGFSRAGNPNPPVVVIYPDETSDEELERLGWWNFHINPYTLQPVNYQPYNIKD